MGSEMCIRDSHNMDDDYYQVKYCPFCGEELDEDNVDEDTE